MFYQIVVYCTYILVPIESSKDFFLPWTAECKDKKEDGQDEHPCLEIVPLPEEGIADGEIPLDGEGGRRVAGSGQRHLGHRHQIRRQVVFYPL